MELLLVVDVTVVGLSALQLAPKLYFGALVGEVGVAGGEIEAFHKVGLYKGTDV
jgi:hypothetical protein